MCYEGAKMVLFVTGICGKNCFYCPVSIERREKDVIFANENRVQKDDDLIDTANSFTAAVEALKKAGAKDIYGAATHPILSGQAVQRIENSSLTKLVVSNTVPVNNKSKKIEVLDVSKLFANAIIRTNENQSISALFKVE